MKSYCLKCRKDTENIDQKFQGSNNGRVSKCATCGGKNQGLLKIKKQKDC